MSGGGGQGEVYNLFLTKLGGGEVYNLFLTKLPKIISEGSLPEDDIQ